MAQTGFTPISIYYSATATNVPTAGNLVAGELAINTADGKLYYKDSAGVVQQIAQSGTLPVSKGGTGAATLTANNVLLGNGTSALQVVAPGTTGNVLTSNGTTWTSAAAAGGGFAAGTVMLFAQTSAPTG